MTSTAEVSMRGYAKGRARRDAIIRTASEHFAENGFVSATILEIAAACGISRAGLLHHFPDKEALLEAVLQARDDEDRGRFDPYVEVAGALGALRGMVDLAARNRLVPGLIELFVRLSAEASVPEHPANKYFISRYNRLRSGTQRAIRAAQRRGHIHPGIDPATSSLRLIAMMDGLQTQWLLDRSIDMAAQIDATVRDWLTPSGTELFDSIPARIANASPTG